MARCPQLSRRPPSPELAPSSSRAASWRCTGGRGWSNPVPSSSRAPSPLCAPAAPSPPASPSRCPCLSECPRPPTPRS
eukprot:7451665-Pyramimonas_sp.AAC.1